MAWFGLLGLPRPREEKEKPLIFDVEQLIADSAWDMFFNSFGWWRRWFLRREKFSIEVPMTFYCFEQEGPPVFNIRIRQLADRDQTTPERPGLDTIFKNDTDKEQICKFTFDKTRKASVTVSYQEGYSIGDSANFSLELSSMLSNTTLGLGMNTSVQVTKSTGQTFEESITTSANSQFTVDKNSQSTVTLTMEELFMLANFELTMIMSIRDKLAHVCIRDKASGDLVFVYKVNNLRQIFEDQRGVGKVYDAHGKVKVDAVKFHIKGMVNVMQSSNVINLKGHRPQQPEEAGWRRD